MNTSRTVLVAAATAAAALALSACGGSSTPGGAAADVTSSATPTARATGPTTSARPAPRPTQPAQVIKVTIGESSVRPRGTRVQVKRNVPVVFDITAVQAGELHAHSTPGQELAYPKGSSTGSLVFKQPGIIAVEDHRLDKLVVQLEVR